MSVVALLGLFTSCTKVIELKLHTSPTQIVIQGNIYDQAGFYVVKISNSVRFSDPNVYPAVTSANVTISDNVGHAEILTESPSGTYTTSSIQGVPGRTYTLTVIANSKTYTAISTMPFPVNIDSLYTKESPFGNKKLLTAKFLDPAGIDNYYRLIEFINDEEQTGFHVTSDRLYQGKEMNFSFMSRGSDSRTLLKGDNVTIWLESIDKGIYEYFRTAGRDGGQSSSPANPTSNINNGALGYFNACSLTKKSAKVL